MSAQSQSHHHPPNRSSRLAGGPGGPSTSPSPTHKTKSKSRATKGLAPSTPTPASRPSPGQKRQAAVRSTFALKRSTDQRIAAAQSALCSSALADQNDLRDAAAILQPGHWDEVALERNLADLCAYPLCKQSCVTSSNVCIVLATNGQQEHGPVLETWTPVTASELALLPATAELALFCSRVCFLRSSYIRLQLSHDPLYLRLPNAKPVSIVLAEDEDAHMSLPEHSATSLLPSFVDDLIAQAAASFSSDSSVTAQVMEIQPNPPTVTPAASSIDSYGIEGYSAKAGNVATRKSASLTPSRAELVAPFTIVTAAFSGVVPKACRLISLSLQPPPSAHLAKPRPSTVDNDDGMVSFNLEKKLQRELFLQRFEAIVVPAIALLDLDHELTHNIMALALELARSLRPTSRSVSLLGSDSGYSWLFCLAIVWGACCPHPSLFSRVFKSKAWSMILREVVLPAIGDDAAIGPVVDECGCDLVERIGRFVFSE